MTATATLQSEAEFIREQGPSGGPLWLYAYERRVKGRTHETAVQRVAACYGYQHEDNIADLDRRCREADEGGEQR